MKKSFFIFASIATLTTAYSNNDEKAVKFYKEGIQLQRIGQFEEALEKLKKATELSPNITKIRYAYISLDRSMDKLLTEQKTIRLNQVFIDKIDFENETLSIALQKLSRIISDYNKKNKTNFTSNIVIRNTEVAKSKVTLNLRNVPLKVVLDNLMIKVNGKYKIEKYVISVDAR